GGVGGWGPGAPRGLDPLQVPDPGRVRRLCPPDRPGDHGAGWSDEWTVTCAEPEAVEAMQWVQDSVFANGWAQVASSDSADTFAAGVCSATIASTGSLVGVLESASFDVGVGFLPGGS